MRAGDEVRHHPSGEDWWVVWVDGDWLVPAGWPRVRAQVAHCEVIVQCDDRQHRAAVGAAVQSGLPGCRCPLCGGDTHGREAP